jgi:hypothetical protein
MRLRSGKMFLPAEKYAFQEQPLSMEMTFGKNQSGQGAEKLDGRHDPDLG